jgi:hypothetical protein
VYRTVPYCLPGPSAVEAAVVEGESPVGRVLAVSRERLRRVGLFGNAALSWW